MDPSLKEGSDEQHSDFEGFLGDGRAHDIGIGTKS